MQISEPLNACSIAARLSANESGLDRPLGAFRGQMSCIYLFQDVLSPGEGSRQFGQRNIHPIFDLNVDLPAWTVVQERHALIVRQSLQTAILFVVLLDKRTRILKVAMDDVMLFWL